MGPIRIVSERMGYAVPKTAHSYLAAFISTDPNSFEVRGSLKTPCKSRVEGGIELSLNPSGGSGSTRAYARHLQTGWRPGAPDEGTAPRSLLHVQLAIEGNELLESRVPSHVGEER